MACGRRCLYSCFLGVTAVAILSLLVLLIIQYKNPMLPRYYASIRSVSSIDSKLEFNMTLGVERRSPLWGQACLNRGTDVAVAYHGLPIAFAAMGGDDVCAPWWKLRRLQRTTVVARASKVGGLPSFVVDRTRRRLVGFTVTFRIDNSGDRGDELVTCVARLFEEKLSLCDVHYP